MIISTCGFGSTGSSAVSDYLSEFDNIQICDSFEFNLPYLPDGLADLEYHIIHSPSRTLSSSYAISRFKLMVKNEILDYYSTSASIDKDQLKKIFNDYIYKITEVSWKGYENVNYNWMKSIGQSIVLARINPFLRKKGTSFSGFPLSDICLAHDNKLFYTETKKLINSLLELVGMEEGKSIVLDQAFSGNNPQASFSFFDNPMAIIVDRDPRDLFVFANEVLIKKPVLFRTIFMPFEDVDDFIKYYRLIRQNQPYTKEDKRILSICFEDLIYNYETTTKEIRDFCKLSDNQNKYKYFNPKVSRVNTQLFRRFPKYENEIKKIEEELSKYCYDFSKYPDIEISGEMFSGQSPLKNRK